MHQFNKALWSRRAILWSAILGLFASSYLFYTYTTDTALRCGILHGCDIVRASQWSHFYGIPTPFFGLIFYLATILLIVFRAYSPAYRPRLMRGLQILFACTGFAESLFLTLIQTFVIHNFCSWCLVSALSTTFIFIFIWFDERINWTSDQIIKELKVIFISLAVGLILGACAFYYLTRPLSLSGIHSSLEQSQLQKITPP